MSGGAFGYLCYDVERVAERLDDVADHCGDVGDYPPEAQERVERLRDDLRASIDLLRAVEWVASGDWGRDRVDEAVADLDVEDEPVARVDVMTQGGTHTEHLEPGDTFQRSTVSVTGLPDDDGREA